MRIAVIGAGNVGGALGLAWSRAGHTIVFGVQDPSSEKHSPASVAAGNAGVTTVAAAARGADLIVLAVPWTAVPAALGACGNLDGRLILDATNPLHTGEHGLELALGFTTSGGEEVARLAPGARVFKTMNQVGHSVMSNTLGYRSQPLMFVAGDDALGKQLVLELVASIGFDAIDAGPLRNARLLEPLAMLWIDQAINHGAPLTNAFGMLRKESGSRSSNASAMASRSTVTGPAFRGLPFRARRRVAAVHVRESRPVGLMLLAVSRPPGWGRTPPARRTRHRSRMGHEVLRAGDSRSLLFQATDRRRGHTTGR